MSYPEDMGRALSAGLEPDSGWEGCGHPLSASMISEKDARLAELRTGLSIAISLKRIADVAEQFGDHPDNGNDYGETGMRAFMGELRRFKQEVLNDVSCFMINRR